MTRIVRWTALGLAAACLCTAVGCEEVEGRTLSSADSLVATYPTDATTPSVPASADAAESLLPTASQEATDSQTATQPLPPPPAHTPQPSFNHAFYIGRPITFVPNNRREIAITFDDGPSAHTERVLSILRANKVHATFFFVGSRASIQDPSVSDAIAQGNEVGNHTWSHSELMKLKPAELDTQIDRAQEMLAAETGSAPLFVRPRSGKFDPAGAAAVWGRGLILVEWSVHANDVEPSPRPAKLVKNATEGVRSGSIILMHETNPNTIVALPAILAKLRHEGFRCVTLSKLMADGRH